LSFIGLWIHIEVRERDWKIEWKQNLTKQSKQGIGWVNCKSQKYA
jgi:hypothetical protein